MLHLQLADISVAKGGLMQVRVKGRAAWERTIYVKKTFLERIKKYFHGQTWLFEHHGSPYSRISVTNRIKHEALKILGKEVTPQQLRHTWAAIQINRGRDIHAVALVLGQRPGTTRTIQTEKHLKPEDSFLDLEESQRTTQGESVSEALISTETPRSRYQTKKKSSLGGDAS
jgi:integrase